MTRNSRSKAWFVRSNGGMGSYPVTPDGWRVVGVFIAGVVASAIMGWVLAMTMPTMLWVGFTALGIAISAIWYIMTARRHTDYSITYSQYVKEKNNA